LAGLDDGLLLLPASPVRHRSRDTEYPYRPDSELFYLTGVTEPDAVAVLQPRGGEQFILFVRERDPDAELWSGERIGTDRARELYGADIVHPIGDLDARLADLLAGSRSIYYRWGAGRHTDSLVLDALARARASGPRSGTGPRGVVDPGELLDEMRMIKDDEEIERIRMAARITIDGFRKVLAVVAPGIGEWELEAVMEGAFRRSGADGAGYQTIVGGGKNTCVLHYVHNQCALNGGDLVLVDAGAEVGMYNADITRTIPVSGHFTGEQRAVYEVVEAARAAAVAAARPGATIGAVHEAAVAIITAGLVELGVLRGSPDSLAEAGKHKPFYPHQTSHWLGLDVHDPGDYAHAGRSRTLEPGMVLTVEPGLYFRPGGDSGAARFENIGVRIEDDLLVTVAGCDNLTSALPTSADGVAELVAGER
jgi:Xaa-Pro aminopeptidase